METEREEAGDTNLSRRRHGERNGQGKKARRFKAARPSRGRRPVHEEDYDGEDAAPQKRAGRFRRRTAAGKNRAIPYRVLGSIAFIVVVALVVLLWQQVREKPRDPSEVVRAYLRAIARNDYDTPLRFLREEDRREMKKMRRANRAMFEGYMGMDFSGNEIVKAAHIKRRAATVAVIQRGEDSSGYKFETEYTVHLVWEDGRWRINLEALLN